MTIAFSQTGRDVVTGAMQDLGIITLSDEPAAEELQYGIEQLNLMLKGLAAEGLTPWTDLEGVAVFDAVGEVTLEPRPIDVSEARLVVDATYQRPLFRLGPGEYDMYPNKAQAGEPLSYEIRRTPTEVKMRVWPVPVTTQAIAYSYNRVIEDVEASAALDAPQMWGEAIREMLKARLTVFKPVPDSVLIRAEMLKRQLLDFDRPESYTIVPER